MHSVNDNFKNKQQRGFMLMRKTYDIAMALLIFSMAIAMFFPEYLKLEMILSYDTFYRIFFGIICCLYGGFRFYRAFQPSIKNEIE